MKGKYSNIRDFGTGLSLALAKRFGEDFRITYLIFTRWPDLVPPGIVSKTRPIFFKEGQLTVLTSTFQWASELRFNKKTLIVKINSGLGGDYVNDIDFMQGIVQPGSVSDVPDPDSDLKLSSAEQDQIELLIKDYDDDFKAIARKMYRFYYIQKKK